MDFAEEGRLSYARNFSCGTTYILCATQFGAVTTTFVVGSEDVDFGYVIGLVCTAQPGSQFCSGQSAGPDDFNYQYSWTSDSSNISIASTSFDGLASHVRVNGETGGTANITGAIYDPANSCRFSARSTGKVHAPSALKKLSADVISYTYLAGCRADYYYIVAAIKYQVLDQDGAAINSASMIPQEMILNQVVNGMNTGDPFPNWVNIGPHDYPGSSLSTDANGQFIDAPIGQCANVAFTDTYTQPISMLIGGKNYLTRTNNWKAVSQTVGHGSFTNNNDVSLSH